jgi:hypothetical protein
MRNIYAVDCGNPRKGNFAWTTVLPDGSPQGSADIDCLVEYLVRDLNSGYSVALGFEAPLFVPVPEDADFIGRARQGEGNRPFSAGAGCGALVVGLQEVAWVLRAIRNQLEKERSVCFSTSLADWPPPEGSQTLFLWEAFVSGDAHSSEHVRDAATAAVEFLAQEHTLANANAVTAQCPLSLVHAAALWSGWSGDTDSLRTPALVIMPQASYEGAILPLA